MIIWWVVPKRQSNLQQALEAADSRYGVSVTQDEVTTYIDEFVAVVKKIDACLDEAASSTCRGR